jgi:EAL domain-containing protein (putative c-di-GMP-specific phosphodiesterase class I)/CHASE2 domain-containing sensor protein
MNARLAKTAALFRRWRQPLVLGLAALVGLGALLSGQAVSGDQQLQQIRDSLRQHEASGELHIVEIDARSLQAIARWPWPRGIHAQIVDRLAQAGVRSIAFDVDFSALSDPAEDAKFAGALARAGGGVSLPTFRQYAGGGAGAAAIVDSLPAPIFREHAFVSAVNVIPDSDAYVRQMPLGVETAGYPRPSLAAFVAERKAVAGEQFPVDYSIDPNSIPRHSVIDLIRGKVPAAALAGKRIIVGATAIESGDRYSVPRYSVIPGVVVQALAAETLMQGRVPSTIVRGPALAITLLLILVALRMRSRRARLILFAGTAVALLTVPLATEAWLALTIPTAAALAALVTAMLAGTASLAFERYLEKAFVDEATGLANVEALASARISDGSALLVARIHRFDTIAAGLTPEATGALVGRVAERLAFSVPDQKVFRVDAADLAWIEPIEHADTLEARLESMNALMRAPIECGRLVDVSLTFGVAPVGANPRQAIANAGLAAAQADEEGSLVRHFEAIDAGAIDWQLSLLGELDEAMARGELWNAYQPKLDVASGRIVACEALVRWTHSERGLIRPDQFIPIVEKAGRIRDLTLYVLEQALDDALAWDRKGYPIGVAVNVSAILLADHAFIERVGQMLGTHHLPDGRVTIEVTETATMIEPGQAVAALNSWRSLGVHVSIDDYGTGQSSLGYLQTLPADELKIDMSFIRTISTDPRNAIMVRSTIALAHELGLKVVAEGVEDLPCLEALRTMGCDIAQGYYIGRPGHADALLAALDDQDRAAA